MPLSLPPAMAEALALTRGGRLRDAAALLRAGTPPHSAAVIDLKPMRKREAPPHAPKDGGPSARSTMERLRHAGPAGTLDYRLHRPASAEPGMPLVVMLHGCTQSAEDFARGTAMNAVADKRGFLVAYPEQNQHANGQKCWNWFLPAHQARDAGEPALIAGVTRDVIAARGADPARVYVAGLSAGGAAAAVMGAVYPDVFAAVGIHSGLACGSARDLPSALQAMKRGGAGASRRGARLTPVIIFHGDADRTVDEANARDIAAAAHALAGAPLSRVVESGISEGGQRYTRERAADDRGRVMIEQWTLHGAGHAWSGGDPSGSYTDPTGPDASRAMAEFFTHHRRPSAAKAASSSA